MYITLEHRNSYITMEHTNSGAYNLPQVAHAAARALGPRARLSSYPRPKPHRPHRVSEIRDLEAVHCTVPVCDKRQTFLPAADLSHLTKKALLCLLA